MGESVCSGCVIGVSENYKGDWKRKRLRVLERDQWRCQWCGEDLKQHGIVATVDHVTSIKLGREQGWTEEQIWEQGNLIASCKSCNSSRSDRPGPPGRLRSPMGSLQRSVSSVWSPHPDTFEKQRWKLTPG